MRQADGTEALERARHLRKEMTPQEKILWSALRSRRLEDAKFRRQMWIGPFIADFACKEAKLVVEADGSQHEANAEYDRARTGALEKEGYRVLRFWNNQVTDDLEGVLTAIRAELLNRLPSPSHPASPCGSLPLPEGERGS